MKNNQELETIVTALTANPDLLDTLVKEMKKVNRPKGRTQRRRLREVGANDTEFKQAAFLVKRQLLRRKKFSSAEYTHRLIQAGEKYGASITRKMAQNYRTRMQQRGEITVMGTPDPVNTVKEIYTFR